MCLICYMFQGIKPLENSLEGIMEENGRLTSRKATDVMLFPPKKRKSSIKPKKVRNVVRATTKSDKDRKKKFEKEPKNPDSKSPFVSEKKGREKIKRFNTTKEIVNKEKLKKRKTKLKSKGERRESEEDFASEENRKEKPKKYDDFELNELSYEEAVQYDHRPCYRVYLSLLKREHRIIFTFFITMIIT